MFGNGTNNGWGPIGPTPTDNQANFKLQAVELRLRDPLVFSLLSVFQLIADIVKKLPENSVRAEKARFLGNKIMNIVSYSDRKTWEEGEKIGKAFLAEENAPSQHRAFLVGHCHIDTCWLWPYSETERKCARSWSSQIRLLERYPFYKFACSQAQQFDWVKKLYPG